MMIVPARMLMTLLTCDLENVDSLSWFDEDDDEDEHDEEDDDGGDDHEGA